jgi:hypothetical protein
MGHPAESGLNEGEIAKNGAFLVKIGEKSANL